MKLCRASNNSCFWPCRLWHSQSFLYGKSMSLTRRHRPPNLKLLRRARQRQNQTLHPRRVPYRRERRPRKSLKVELRKTETSSLALKTLRYRCWILRCLISLPGFGSRTRRDRLLGCVGRLTIVQGPVSSWIPRLFARRPTFSFQMAPSFTPCSCSVSNL
jgi:hypothetical protein